MVYLLNLLTIRIGFFQCPLDNAKVRQSFSNSVIHLSLPNLEDNIMYWLNLFGSCQRNQDNHKHNPQTEAQFQSKGCPLINSITLSIAQVFP